MITPFMHIMSCLDDEYKVGGPLNILYLNRQDRELVVSEAKRFCNTIMNENQFYCTTSDTGLRMIGSVQSIADTATSINPYTALMLTRLLECAPTYLHEVDSTSAESVEDDLSTDAVVLRLEGNPKYVYFYVYNVMEMPSLTYDAKITRLKELLLTVESHIVDNSSFVYENSKNDNPQKKNLITRLELHSKFNYWKGMLLQDYIKYYGTIPPDFTQETLTTIKRELWDLGFYGFINPLEMYIKFNNSRVSRKISVNIEDWVVGFLTKIVLSGGATLE